MHAFASLAKLSQVLFNNFIKLATVFCVNVILSKSLSCGQLLFRGWHYDFLTRLKDIDKIKTAIIIMYLNVPSCEVKNQPTFYKVRWFRYSFCNSVYSMF